MKAVALLAILGATSATTLLPAQEEPQGVAGFLPFPDGQPDKFCVRTQTTSVGL